MTGNPARAIAGILGIEHFIPLRSARDRGGFAVRAGAAIGETDLVEGRIRLRRRGRAGTDNEGERGNGGVLEHRFRKSARSHEPGHKAIAAGIKVSRVPH
jgi:hypothetical protein